MSRAHLPPQWEMVELKDVARVKYGKARPNSPGAIPVIGSGGVYGWTSEPLVKFSTLVIGRKGTAGLVYLLENPCWPSDTTFYLEWKAKAVDQRYLYYHLLANPLSGQHARTTLPSLQRPDLDNYPFPLPPLHEQHTIVKALQAVQEAREVRRREAALERERKAALMDYLFTHGTHGEPRQQTEIGEIPQSWQVMRLKKISEEFISGGTPSTDEPDYWDGDIPWTTSALISNDDILLNCGQRFITKVGLKNSATHLVPKDNLLVGTRVGVGKAVVNLIDIAISQDLTGLVLNYKIVNPEFIAYQFKTARVKVFFDGRKRGTTIKGIARLDLESLLLSIPPILEQYELSGILKACDAKIAALEQEAALLEELFRAMLEELMTGRLSALPLVEAEGTA